MNSSTQLPEPLTPRENDILALLGQNLSDRAIAERLVLSLNSVKWYTRQVYGKLGVANRQETVAKARALGLLPGEAAPASKPFRHLPRPLSSFIGREKEVAQVVHLVRQHPLVTLIGAGGVGKTRLAQAVAWALLSEFQGEGWYVELTSLDDPQMLAHFVAGQIGAREVPGQSMCDSLISYLQDRPALLVLDNCEHLADSCARLTEGLLSALPQLKVLATSRELLRVNGEVVFYVPSLTFPPQPADPQDDGCLPLEACLQYEAVRLFVERARAAATGFALTAGNAGAVAQICRRLDGIPLAIELAAARTRALSAAEIAARLDGTFALLSSASRTDLPRHQTLRALIDWSYQLLSAEEQLLLQRLAVFSGGWTLEAAEDVCSEEGGQPGTVLGLEKAAILDLLCGLVDKSLVQAAPGAGQEPRYHLLEMVRQFAQAQLAASGGEAAVRDRHLAYYEQLALRAEPHLRAKGSVEWLDRLEQELPNLRGALEWSHKTGQLEAGLRLAAALPWFWMIRNHQVEGARWLDRLLVVQRNSKIQNFDSKIVRGRALNALNLLLYGLRWFSYSLEVSFSKEELLQESLSIFQGLGEAYQRDCALALFPSAQSIEDLMDCRDMFLQAHEPFWVAECDCLLSLHLNIGYEKALFFAQENLALRNEIGDIDGQGGALRVLGEFEGIRGNFEQCIENYYKAIACLEKVGDFEYVAWYRGLLSFYLTIQGRYEEASQQLEIQRTLALELRIPFVDLNYALYKGYLAWVKTDFNETIRCANEALKILMARSDTNTFLPIHLLTRVAVQLGDLDIARVHLKKILSLSMLGENVFYISLTIHDVGLLAESQGHMQRFITFVSARDNFDKKIGWQNPIIYQERSEIEKRVMAARAIMGEENFRAAWEAGRAMTKQQVSQYMNDYLLESERSAPTQPGGQALPGSVL